MIVKHLPPDQAQGALLAHTQRLPGKLLRKGTMLDSAAIASLRAAGLSSVMVALLEPGDVPEDEAAAQLAEAVLAEAVLAPGVQCSPAATGRVNLRAAMAGLFRVDAARLRALNMIDEALTIATLPDATPVRAGTMLATIKIIPFAVPLATLTRAAHLARAAPPLRLAPYRGLRVGLVLSLLPGLQPSLLDATIRVTEARVRALGGTLLPPWRVAHGRVEIAEAFTQALELGADLLLCAGASAVVDRADSGPAAIVAAGGTIDHFGMPVDPGNLMCLGHIGAVPAIILPGCARSPALNGIDLLLRLICAGEPAGRAEIMAMGAGGLLKEFAGRPAPRAAPARRDPVDGQGGVTAVILAAGLSSRMTPRNKLLLPDTRGRAMVARVALACAASPAAEILVVLGHQAAAVEAAVRAALQDEARLRFILVPDYAAGLSASLRGAIAALHASASAAIICLGDMPLVTGAMISRIIAAHDRARDRAIIVPCHAGQDGNPMLWDRQFFADIMSLRGDAGARGLLPRYPGLVHRVDMANEAVLLDFDTPESLAAETALTPANVPLSEGIDGP